MKKFKYFACSIALASVLLVGITPHNVYAEEDGATVEETTETTTSEDGNTTTTTTTTVTTNEDGTTDTHIEEVNVVKVQSASEMPLTITMPGRIVHPVNEEYVINFTVNHTYDLEGVRMIKGQKSYTDWDSASPISSSEFTIPQEQSDSWYTVIAKDVNGNWAVASVYAHCEIESTPTPTATSDCPEGTTRQADGTCVTPTPDCPEGTTRQADGTCAAPLTVTPVPPTTTPDPETKGCPDGYTMKDDGQCYAENPGCPEGYKMQDDGVCVPTSCPDGYTMDANGNCVACPDGYQMDSTGNCVKTPTAVAQNTCPEGQYMDENGNCVDKVASLPQTGGFDSLMIFFIFGIGVTACGAGVIAYAKKKENDDNIVEEDDIDEDDED